MCQIRHMVLTIGIDRILICGVFASDSILILNKVLSLHSKEHTFFIKKVRHQLFNSTNRNIIQISKQSLVDNYTTFLFYLQPKNNH